MVVEIPACTLPKLNKLYRPVDEYLSGFTHNQALLDIIDQHFFKKTPAYFALSYFSLYLDYRYPRGGTRSFPQALEQFILENHGEIKTETEITCVDPGNKLLIDSNGNGYQYKKLVWAADLKTFIGHLNLANLKDTRIASMIQARQKALSTKIGGDSVFTLYLTINLDKAYFAELSNPHFFYTPSTSGLSNASLSDLIDTGTEWQSRIYLGQATDYHLAESNFLNSIPLRSPALFSGMKVLRLLVKQV